MVRRDYTAETLASDAIVVTTSLLRANSEDRLFGRFRYGTALRTVRILSRRAIRFLSVRITVHGAYSKLVDVTIFVAYLVKSAHFDCACLSIGLVFHCRKGSV